MIHRIISQWEHPARHRRVQELLSKEMETEITSELASKILLVNCTTSESENQGENTTALSYVNHILRGPVAVNGPLPLPPPLIRHFQGWKTTADRRKGQNMITGNLGKLTGRFVLLKEYKSKDAIQMPASCFNNSDQWEPDEALLVFTWSIVYKKQPCVVQCLLYVKRRKVSSVITDRHLINLGVFICGEDYYI